MSTEIIKNVTNNTTYYEECATNLDKPESVDYLASRGVSLATAKQFGCGFDATTNCIVVPINEQSYIARSTDPYSSVRFKNPVGQETGISNSEALFSDDPVPIFVVKGVFDMLGVAEAGANAIALNGVAQSKLLIELIKNAGKKVDKTLLIDLGNDLEGQKNSQKLAEALGEIGVKCQVVEISCGYRDQNEALQHDKAAFISHVKANVSKITKPDNTFSYFILGEMAKDIAEMKSHEHLSTGFDKLDRKMGVLTNGLYIVGGVPSVGKTTFMLQLADQMAKAGEHILYFTLEQDMLDFVSKSTTRESASRFEKEKGKPGTYVNNMDIQFDSKPWDAHAALWDYFGSVDDRFNLVTSFSGLTPQGIENKVKDYIHFNNVKPIVFVDYLQTLSAEVDPETHRKATDVKQIVDDNINRLQGLSKSMGLLIFAISSLNRSNYMNPLDFESFKESGKIEYGADRLFGLQLSIVREPEFVTASPERKRELFTKAKEANPRKIDFTCLKNRKGFPVFTQTFNYFPDRDLYRETDV